MEHFEYSGVITLEIRAPPHPRNCHCCSVKAIVMFVLVFSKPFLQRLYSLLCVLEVESLFHYLCGQTVTDRDFLKCLDPIRKKKRMKNIDCFASLNPLYCHHHQEICFSPWELKQWPVPVPAPQ